MKVGSVYRIVREDKEIVGVLVSKKLRSWDGYEEIKIVTTAGGEEKIILKGSEKIVSPRLSHEVRNQLKMVKKEWDRFSWLEREIEKLQNELCGQRTVLKEAKQTLAIVSDEFDPNIFRDYRDITRYSTSRDNPTFTVSVLKQVDKYASSEQYDFLYREYDNAVFIRNTEDCLNAFKLTIPKHKVDQLLEKLTVIKLEGIDGECSLEDKETLMVGEAITFVYSKKATRSEMLRELDIVSEWVERAETYLQKR